MTSAKRLFEAQKENQIGYGTVPRPNKVYISSMLLALNEEVAELARELSPHWKTWKPGIVDADRVVDEAADVFIFLMNILLAYGITAEEYGDAVYTKQLENRTRADHVRKIE